ncbi:hypothetical protein QJS66_19010 [Kocuria rhizophila]|nr:hypothetical protein QJS66_19010 [Kocuria rhizophila]
MTYMVALWPSRGHGHPLEDPGRQGALTGRQQAAAERNVDSPRAPARVPAGGSSAAGSAGAVAGPAASGASGGATPATDAGGDGPPRVPAPPRRTPPRAPAVRGAELPAHPPPGGARGRGPHGHRASRSTAFAGGLLADRRGPRAVGQHVRVLQHGCPGGLRRVPGHADLQGPALRGSHGLGLALTMLCLATIRVPTPVSRLSLPCNAADHHVSIAVAASGVFTITFAMAVLAPAAAASACWPPAGVPHGSARGAGLVTL